MFKHILLPTDGSATSDIAVQKGIALAKAVGAKITAVHVIPEFHIFTYQTEMLEDTREQFAKESTERAGKYLEQVVAAAQAAGVECSTLCVTGDDPYLAIIKAAEDAQCDLITMASHGRKGVKGLLLGSETQKVLTHSAIPVLVYR